MQKNNNKKQIATKDNKGCATSVFYKNRFPIPNRKLRSMNISNREQQIGIL